MTRKDDGGTRPPRGGGRSGSGGKPPEKPPGGGSPGPPDEPRFVEALADILRGEDAPPEATPAAKQFEPQAAIGSADPIPEGDTTMADDVKLANPLPVPAMATAVPIILFDARERNQAERKRLENELWLLKARAAEDKDNPPPDVVARIQEIEALLQNPDSVVDPFFLGVRQALIDTGVNVASYHVGGFLASQQVPGVPAADVIFNDGERKLAAVYGLLEADNLVRPETGDRFVTAVSVALGEYAASRALFDRVLEVISTEGLQRLTLSRPFPAALNPGGGPQLTGTFRVVRADQWAEVTRDLRRAGVTADDEQLAAKVRARFQDEVASSDGLTPSATDIDLPDLEEQADLEILADNVRATQAIHFAAMLEELKLFQVVDKLVELFQNGLLPFGRGRAGDLLYGYWKKGIDRLSEAERRNIYARVFGMAGGDPSIGNPNREFGDLFLRFASAVSEYVRQFQVDDLLRSTVPFRVSEETIRKAGRDLAANLSLHGYGIAHFAATELQAQLNEMIAILSDAEVKNAYGARDMFQVVDQVATLELGGARNSIRYRTMATSGAVIIRWLAERADVLTRRYGPVLDMAVVRRPPVRPPGQKPTTNPTDRDLVDAVEQYLAITGTPEQRVEEYAQPVESPNLTSRPIQIPQVARDLLESVGVSAGYGGGGNGHGNRWGGYR